MKLLQLTVLAIVLAGAPAVMACDGSGCSLTKGDDSHTAADSCGTSDCLKPNPAAQVACGSTSDNCVDGGQAAAQKMGKPTLTACGSDQSCLKDSAGKDQVAVAKPRKPSVLGDLTADVSEACGGDSSNCKTSVPRKGAISGTDEAAESCGSDTSCKH
jgi:hypothetical protein